MVKTKDPSALSEASSTEKRLSPFIKKLWGIMNDISLHSIIRWSEQGSTVCICNSILFCKSVLPHYFKHNNWHSFVRQLNLYGFRKVYHFNIAIDYASGRQETVWQFKHQHFYRNGEESLLLIQRKLPMYQTIAPAKNQKITKILSDIEKRLAVAEKEHKEVKIETLLLRQQQQDQQKMLSRLMEEVASVTKKLSASHASSHPCVSCHKGPFHHADDGTNSNNDSNGNTDDNADTNDTNGNSERSVKGPCSLPPFSDIMASIDEE